MNNIITNLLLVIAIVELVILIKIKLDIMKIGSMREKDELGIPLHQQIEICDSRACKQIEHNEVYQWD